MPQAVRDNAEKYRAPVRRRNLRVDLVVLITCFGTMAAVAVPRHLSLTETARRTELSSLTGSLNSAADLGHRLWLAAGRPDSLETEGGQLDLINGFPSALTLSTLLKQSELMPFHFQNGIWQHRAGSPGDACSVSYQPPRRIGENLRITVDETGC
jgi:hypothetical protein